MPYRPFSENLPSPTLKTQCFFIWHVSCIGTGTTQWRVAEKGNSMTNLSNARQTALALAAAFITSMIFVSTAVGPAAHLAFA